MGASTTAADSEGKTTTTGQRAAMARKYCEQALDALRVAETHLATIHSAQAARLTGDVLRQQRLLRLVIGQFPK